MNLANHSKPHPKSFFITTSNLLNLARPERIYYENARPYSVVDYEQKITGLAQLLSNAQSDIIAAQEVWDEISLQELAVRLGFDATQVIAPMASNEANSALTQGLGASKTPAVGLISKFEILNWQILDKMPASAVVNIPDEGEYAYFNRPPLVATLSIYGQEVTVITTHLKSKRPHYLRDEQGNRLEDYNDPQIRVRAKLRSLCMRAAEAAALRLFIIQKLHNTHHPLILLGDMNDVTDSVTTQLMAETNEVSYDKGMRDIVLFDAAKIQTTYGWMQGVAYTHLYQGMPEVIDQLFVSEEFLVDSKFSLGEVERVDYFNDHLKWEYQRRVTDHGMVRAKITLK